MTERIYDKVGVDQAGDVFRGGAIFQVAVNVLTNIGRRHSDFAVSQAEMAAGGFLGKRIIDVGCGFGTTMLAIAKHIPAEIVALDSSPEQTELFRTILLSEENLEVYLKGALEEVFEDLSETVRNHFIAMRKEFNESTFRRNGGKVSLHTLSCLDLTREVCGIADVMVANNMIHWPINARSAKFEKNGVPQERAFSLAIREVLKPLYEVLRPGGILAVCEPRDFVKWDTQPLLDADIASHTAIATSANQRTHTIMNEMLLTEWGITKSLPKPLELFKVSEVERLFAENGFRLLHIGFCEQIYKRGEEELSDAVDAVFAGIPLFLGSVEVPFERKIEIAKRVRQLAKATLDKDNAGSALRGYSFTFILKRE